MLLEEIIHGTQYYRSPTPLPSEWEGDIARMAEFNIDAFQIRINWRTNERIEDVYDFSDVDEVMALAEKYNRKVIMKIQLECAPQYVFDKYDGVRIGAKGEKLHDAYHGAFYGGWRPCFTNPMVQERAKKFVAQVAKRYADRKNIILWNAWNEIRNRPIEDCFCPHCRAAFGKYLQNKFGTIERLNDFYGAEEESFERIHLPAMAHGFWDMYEFKKFKGSAELYNWVRFVYDEIRKYDKDRPIMSHVGFTGAFQYTLNDVCDDFAVSKAVDFWGTSVPCDSEMDTHERRTDYFMLNDFMRAVDENYFVHEIYPGLGMFRWYDTPFDMRFKLYAALSAGAKGLIYWQYRAERLANEQDCAGIMRMDGSPRPVAYEAQKFGGDLHRNMSCFVGAKAKKADVAIVFDFNSQLLSEIEDMCGKDFTFERAADAQSYYRYAHAGMYRLLTDGGYNVDYVNAAQTEKFREYKVLYFPYYTMLDRGIVPALQAFTEKGGIVIADEGFGMRQPNTWMQPYDIDCKPIMTARLRERRLILDEYITAGNERVKIRPFKSEYDVQNAEKLLSFDNGIGALHKINVGKGAFYLCGFSIGYSYYETKDRYWRDFMDGVLNGLGVKPCAYADVENGLYERRLQNGDKEILFLFNCTENDKTVTLKENAAACQGGELCGENVKIPPFAAVYLTVKNKDTI